VFAPGGTTPLYTVDQGYSQGGADSAAFSPDGTILATGGDSGDVRFWDASTGFPAGPSVATVAGWVLDLAWNPSGTMLVSSGTDGTVRLIDVATRTIVGALPDPGNDWVDTTISPDGSRAYVAYGSGRGFDWAIDPAIWARDACAIAGRTLTQAEWSQYLPGRPYAPACLP
jgi:WD40 repeat protein